jgi:K+-sensing histidine kinase KdpD
MRAPIPTDEQERLRALRQLDILDTGPEPDLDDIVELASWICGTPSSLVSFVDADRQWFKAQVNGTDGLTAGGCESPRDESFCAHAILGRGLLVVPDAREDQRFADNPHVIREPGVRFYAGAPLVTTDGHALGTLCVVDSVPRKLNAGQLRALRALARQVTAQLELRRYTTDAALEAARWQEIERFSDDLVPLIGTRLREPLAELRRCAEVLRDLDACPPALAARVGGAVHAHAPDLLRVLDNLLRAAGPDSGSPALQRRDIDLNSLVEWAVRESQPIADAKDIVLRLDVGGPAKILADPRRLAQALAHLMFTAVKYTPCGGRVRVRVDPTGHPTVELHDVGVVDEPARLYEHVLNGAIRGTGFDPDGGRGADAGLTAVKAIFDAHHACVALCDGTDDGTALHVVFPGISSLP